ncbi:DUF1206 domain-containing protein [Mesonia aquimarina]|uniref:DUF1206 domain-containing protein n=1 Tax=Mesonia aquimarina TaxID=1504967 RepID=UPI000EF60F46|nr:DUF1206 domain-containing protein [Mesonia aquimarina]
MNNSTKIIARTGFISMGFIYAIVGFLTLLAALNLGGDTSGKSQALDFIKKQPFGKVLLIALAAGLLSYAIWRFIQVFQDPENIGNSTKGIFEKIGLFISAFAYIAIAGLALKHVFSSGGSNSSSFLLDKFDQQLVSILFIIIGLSLAGKAIFHLIKALQGKVLENFHIKDLKAYKIIKYLGYLGFYARAVVVGIIAYFFLRAGFVTGNENIKGTKEAFSFLRDSEYGGLLMAITAAGLLSYGIFIISLSRYHSFEKNKA